LWDLQHTNFTWVIFVDISWWLSTLLSTLLLSLIGCLRPHEKMVELSLQRKRGFVLARLLIQKRPMYGRYVPLSPVRKLVEGTQPLVPPHALMNRSCGFIDQL
jgi:hypothetical protein